MDIESSSLIGFKLAMNNYNAETFDKTPQTDI